MKKRLYLVAFVITSWTFAQIPDGYYDGTQGKTGYELKTALKEIITNGHTDQGYDNLYNLYQNSDSDNYYENDGTVLDMYSEIPSGADSYEYTHVNDKCGSYSGEGDCYNREHIMPQSAFNSAAPMKDDGHFVVPSDGYVNNRRSNYPFGIVNNPDWTSSNGSKIGPNATGGYSGTVFEPIDEFKGDIARMLFYVATRYEDQIDSWSNDMLNGTTDQVFADWFLDILLQWHQDDPVSQREIDRNEAVYNYQGNRNPFIDHPEWVTEIWGNRNSQSPSTTEIIAIQDFEGTTPEWTYTEHDSGYNCFDINTGYQGNSTNALRIRGTNEHNADPYIELQNIDISSYNNVKLSVYFAAHGPDSGDDLYLDISYDNGNSWTSTKLVDGYSNADLNFGDTNTSDPTTVSANPYEVDIDDAETQIMVRIRYNERSSKNNTNDFYYVDDIKLTGEQNAPCTSPPATDAVFYSNSPTGLGETGATLKWTNGDGDSRIVILRSENQVTFVPQDGQTYPADANFGNGADVSGNGEYVVFNGSSNQVDVTGLTPGTEYFAKIYEYNCSSGNELYYTTGNPATDVFITLPGKANVFSPGCISNNSIQLSWAPPATGDYTGYLLVAREGATPHSVNSLDPGTNLNENTDYTQAATYGSTSPSSRILYKGTSTSVTVTGLTTGTEYTFALYTYRIGTSGYKYSYAKTLTRTIYLNDVTSPMAVGGNTKLPSIGRTLPFPVSMKFS
jgi:endonuclease I